MKRILILLLAVVVTGGLYYGCGNKKSSGNDNDNPAEKWVISKGTGKADNGNLVIDLPKDTKWDLTIYAAGSSKVLSNTMLQTSFMLPPGFYDLEINHISIKGVPVEKGNDTRLKAGILQIRNKIPWTLYDEAKKEVLINGSSGEERGLPIGKYKLVINKEEHDIEIKDGKKVKY